MMPIDWFIDEPDHQVVIERGDCTNFQRQILGEPLEYYYPKEILGKSRDVLREQLRKFSEERELTMPVKSSTMQFDCHGLFFYETRTPEIKNVIFNDPATIIFWDDGTKTVVKCENEEFDKEKGLAMAFMKKMLGNKGRYFNEVKKWTGEGNS